MNCVSQSNIIVNNFFFFFQIYSINVYMIVFIFREFKNIYFFFFNNLFITIIMCSNF